MYAVSTYRMSEAMRLEFLGGIPRVFFWLALLAWAFAFLGMARRVVAALCDLVRSPRPVGE